MSAEGVGSGSTGVGIPACIAGSISGYERIGGNLDSGCWVSKPCSEGVSGIGGGREGSDGSIVGDG